VAEVLLFHHPQGLTPGVLAFADELRAAGHVVHTPDLYEGKTFGTVEEGVAHAREVGFGTILDRDVAVAEDLLAELVYAGFSLGGMPAQNHGGRPVGGGRPPRRPAYKAPLST
jgi:dienelactone hydrolase